MVKINHTSFDFPCYGVTISPKLNQVTQDKGTRVSIFQKNALLTLIAIKPFVLSLEVDLLPKLLGTHFARILALAWAWWSRQPDTPYSWRLKSRGSVHDIFLNILFKLLISYKQFLVTLDHLVQRPLEHLLSKHSLLRFSSFEIGSPVEVELNYLSVLLAHVPDDAELITYRLVVSMKLTQVPILPVCRIKLGIQFQKGV